MSVDSMRVKAVPVKGMLVKTMPEKATSAKMQPSRLSFSQAVQQPEIVCFWLVFDWRQKTHKSQPEVSQLSAS